MLGECAAGRDSARRLPGRVRVSASRSSAYVDISWKAAANLSSRSAWPPWRAANKIQAKRSLFSFSLYLDGSGFKVSSVLVSMILLGILIIKIVPSLSTCHAPSPPTPAAPLYFEATMRVDYHTDLTCSTSWVRRRGREDPYNHVSVHAAESKAPTHRSCHKRNTVDRLTESRGHTRGVFDVGNARFFSI